MLFVSLAWTSALLLMWWTQPSCETCGGEIGRARVLGLGEKHCEKMLRYRTRPWYLSLRALSIPPDNRLQTTQLRNPLLDILLKRSVRNSHHWVVHYLQMHRCVFTTKEWRSWENTPAFLNHIISESVGAFIGENQVVWLHVALWCIASKGKSTFKKMNLYSFSG